MKRAFSIFWKKCISGVLILSLGLSFFSLPKKTEAAMPVADVLNKPSHLLNAINISADHLKKFVLDGLARAVAQRIIQRLTKSIVAWINSGFNGNPSFVTDPKGFFVDVADQVAGDFLTAGGLDFLCSPFKLQLKLSLINQYSQRRSGPPQCTLSGALSNIQNFQGFMSGNFYAGGWPGWISLTQEPQNNPYGAMLIADAQLGIQIQSKQKIEEKKLDWGRGFLSMGGCQIEGVEFKDKNGNVFYRKKGDKGKDIYDKGGNKFTPTDTGEYLNSLSGDLEGRPIDDVNDNSGTPTGNNKCLKDSGIQTPGSIIQDQLNQVLPSQLRSLEVADEINEIVGALINQMLNQIFGGIGGLLGASKSNDGSGKSFLDRYAEEGDQSTVGVKKNLKNEIDRNIREIERPKYRTLKESSLKLLDQKSDIWTKIYECYENRIGGTATTTIGMSDNLDLEEASTTISVDIPEQKEAISNDIFDITNASSTLRVLADRLENAFSADAITEISTEYQTYIGNNEIPSVSSAQSERDTIREDIKASRTILKQCGL